MTEPLLFPKALILATEAHGQQRDKGGELYILHPLTVALDFEDDMDRTVAVLHDVVEDTEVDLTTIELTFGTEIRDDLEALTRKEVSPGVMEKYSDFIRRASLRPRSRKIKLRDIAHNSRPERYHPGLSGLQGRYIKAEKFLVEVVKEGDLSDLTFLHKFGYIGYNEFLILTSQL